MRWFERTADVGKITKLERRGARIGRANRSDVTYHSPGGPLFFDNQGLLGSGGIMKFGIRKPSLRKSLAARASPMRIIRHSLGLKAPRGYGWITNPKRAAYNRLYNRTTVSAWSILGAVMRGLFRPR